MIIYISFELFWTIIDRKFISSPRNDAQIIDIGYKIYISLQVCMAIYISIIIYVFSVEQDIFKLFRCYAPLYMSIVSQVQAITQLTSDTHAHTHTQTHTHTDLHTPAHTQTHTYVCLCNMESRACFREEILSTASPTPSLPHSLLSLPLPLLHCYARSPTSSFAIRQVELRAASVCTTLGLL